MAQTLDIGPLFVHMLKVRPGPLIHFGSSQEVERPYRHSRVVVMRLWPLRRALAFGWWRDTGLTEEQALTKALQGYGIDLYNEDVTNPEVRAIIRENVAKVSETVDDEWLILDALGLGK